MRRTSVAAGIGRRRLERTANQRAADTLGRALRACVACVAVLLTSCSQEIEAPQPRLVVLYLPCTVNKTYLSAYNSAVPYTPNLNAFSQEALIFENHVTEAGLSGTAYASIFSGGHATTHGVYAHPKYIPKSLYLITEAFRDSGYETFFWAGQPMARASLNGQGIADGNLFDRALFADDPVFTGVLSRLGQEPDYKALVISAFTATHAPYNQRRVVARFCREYPGECRSKRRQEFKDYVKLYRDNHLELSYDYARTAERLELSDEQRTQLNEAVELLYKSNIHQLDQLFGAVLDRIETQGLERESLVLFTADHGEVLSRSNALFRWTHGHALAPEVLSVPMLLRAPGAAIQPGRYAQVSRSIDIFPTLVALSDLALPADVTLAGVDLSPGMLGRQDRPELLGYSHTALAPSVSWEPATWEPFAELYPRTAPELIWVSIRRGDHTYKYRNVGDENFGSQVFDLRADPEETTNRYDPANPLHAEMLAKLIEYKSALGAAYPRHESGDAAQQIPAAEQMEYLRSLGYVR